MKKLSIVLALVSVFCFGSIVFAQNANSSTTMTNDSSASMAGRKHGRRHSRRHGRRHGRRSTKANATTGNANK
ncbi:MAG: hypothetical protein WBP93_20900 [Pyrinomonadaceae bacterium]